MMRGTVLTGSEKRPVVIRPGVLEFFIDCPLEKHGG
jgi:hypothetical protein